MGNEIEDREWFALFRASVSARDAGGEGAVEAARALLAALPRRPPGKLVREDFDECLFAADVLKRTARPGTPGEDLEAYLDYSRTILDLSRRIAALPPPGNRLRPIQATVFCWALFALAESGATAGDRAAALRRLLPALLRRFTAFPRAGGREESDCRKLFHSVVRLLRGNAIPDESLPPGTGSLYLDLLEKRGCSLFAEADFQRKEISPEVRAKTRLKAYPSFVENAIGLAHRFVKSGGGRVRPGPVLLEFLRGHADAGEWFAYYYAVWLQIAGRGGEAVSFMAETVRKMRSEAWAWLAFAGCFPDAPGKARTCLCRSLLCKTHDPQIAAAMAKKTHHRLADLLDSAGETTRAAAERALADSGGNPSGDDLAFYRETAAGSDELAYAGTAHKAFSGTFHAAPGKPFGFVEQPDRPRGREGVFVPPPLARRLRDGDAVAGIALPGKDRHGRDGWCADTIQRIPATPGHDGPLPC